MVAFLYFTLLDFNFISAKTTSSCTKHSNCYNVIKKKNYSWTQTIKINGKFFRTFRTYPFFNDGISVMQSRFGDQAARSLCRLRRGGSPGHGSWLAGAGGCRWPRGFCVTVVGSRIIWRSSQWRFLNLSSWKEETWKFSGLNRNRTHDLCDTGAAL